MLSDPIETDKRRISNCVKNRSKNGHVEGNRIVKYEGVELERW